MRRVRTRLALYSKFRHRIVHRRGQFLQSLIRMHSDPKYACNFCSREETRLAERNLEGTRLHARKRRLQLLELRIGKLSDELQREVQRLRLHPPNVRRKAGDAFDEAHDLL